MLEELVSVLLVVVAGLDSVSLQCAYLCLVGAVLVLVVALVRCGVPCSVAVLRSHFAVRKSTAGPLADLF